MVQMSLSSHTLNPVPCLKVQEKKAIYNESFGLRMPTDQCEGLPPLENVFGESHGLPPKSRQVANGLGPPFA